MLSELMIPYRPAQMCDKRLNDAFALRRHQTQHVTVTDEGSESVCNIDCALDPRILSHIFNYSLFIAMK